MILWYLPYVREGFRPSGDGFSTTVGWRAQARVTTRVASTAQPGPRHRHPLRPARTRRRRSASTPRRYCGSCPRRTVVAPSPNSSPPLNSTRRTCPGRTAPSAPNANRVIPWLCLIVLEEQTGVTLSPGSQGQSQWILGLDPAGGGPRTARPDRGMGVGARAGHLRHPGPDRGNPGHSAGSHHLAGWSHPGGCCRIGATSAASCPPSLAGVVAGLGADPEAIPAATARNLAWTATDVPAELPVYFTWSFTTGEAGDVESMLRRLRPAPPSTVPCRPLECPRGLRRSAAGRRLAATAAPAAAADRRSPRPATIVDGIRAALAPGVGDGPVVGPPFLGEPWVAGRPLDPINAWTPALNLTPMARAAAGLGADLVRDKQEELVAAVWQQFVAYRQTDLQQRSQQLSTIVENQIKGRLHAAPIEEASRVLGPVVTQMLPGAPQRRAAYRRRPARHQPDMAHLRLRGDRHRRRHTHWSRRSPRPSRPRPRSTGRRNHRPLPTRTPCWPRRTPAIRATASHPA